jgi:hypothetical protein
VRLPGVVVVVNRWKIVRGHATAERTRWMRKPKPATARCWCCRRGVRWCAHPRGLLVVVVARQPEQGSCCSQGVGGRGLADFSGSKPCPRMMVAGVSVRDDAKSRTEKNEVFCRAYATGKERVGSVAMKRQRKCCRCPRPSEVDSDGRGGKLLLLRSRKVGGCGEDNTLFISIVLQDYSLYALHLAIPPPWGFHLSNPPNI